MDGILNIYKEKGYTSHDVVAIVRRTLKEKRVGHTGTLDPDAEGVLPVCVGKATKLADYIMNSGKTYTAEITFGAETTTQDASGEITNTYTVDFDEEKIKAAIESFKGEYMQLPPMYSAIKINGKKLYEFARKGQEVERKARKVVIYNITAKQFMAPDKAIITVDCSKGTYIRALCEDIGKKLGFGAYMSALTRTRSSAFDIKDSIRLSQLQELCENGRLAEALMPMEKALESYKKAVVLKSADNLMHNGARIYSEYITRKITPGETVTGFDSTGVLVGIYTAETDETGRGYIRPATILL